MSSFIKQRMHDAYARTIRAVRQTVYKMILGTIIGCADPTLFTASVQLLTTHLAILGGTRFGKSKFLEQICRELTVYGRLHPDRRVGYLLLDPNSDCADDVFAYLTYHQRELGLRRDQIYYLKPDDALFSFDPFIYRPDPSDPNASSDYAYHCWFHGKIKDMVAVITRKQGESAEEAAKMVRLRRWMYNVLFAVGIRQADGSHLTLNDAIPLLTPSDPRHNALYSRVEPFLSDDVRSDFIKLRKTKDPRKQEDWVESTINRLREVNSPKLRLMFGGHAESINPRDILLQGGVVLASLGKTPTFHEDDGQVMGGLLLLEFFYAAKTIPRELRRHFLALIDEAQHYINPDMVTMMKEGAKYQFSLGLCIQQLDNLQHKSSGLDLVPTVLGMCGVRVSFRQKFYEHAKILAESLCFPMVDFTELVQEIERHDGYDWVTVVSQNFSRSQSQSRSLTAGESHSSSRGKTTGTSTTESIARSVGKSAGESRTVGRGRSLMNGRSFSFSLGQTDSRSQADGITSGVTDSESTSTGASLSHSTNKGESTQFLPGRSRDSRTESGAITDGRSTSDQSTSGRNLSSGQSHTVTTGVSRERTRGQVVSQQHGNSESTSNALSAGTSSSTTRGRSTSRNQSVTNTESHGTMSSVSVGITDGSTEGYSISPTPLPRIIREQQRTGRLEMSVPDQLALHTQTLMTLPKQHCLVALDEDQRAFVMRVANVLDPFEQRGNSPKFRDGAIAAFKKKLFTKLACFFIPKKNTRIVKPPSSRGPGIT